MQSYLKNFEVFIGGLSKRKNNLSATGNDELLNFFEKELNLFYEVSSMIISLANPNLKQKHIEEIFALLDVREVQYAYNYLNVVKWTGKYKKD
jgi:hypothetical protein